MIDYALRQSLLHVLWIGGATDAGKTTVAQILAARHGLHLYNYDRHDLRHHQHLAPTSSHYRAFLSASMDERWVRPTPEDLLRLCNSMPPPCVSVLSYS